MSDIEDRKVAVFVGGPFDGTRLRVSSRMPIRLVMRTCPPSAQTYGDPPVPVDDEPIREDVYHLVKTGYRIGRYEHAPEESR